MNVTKTCKPGFFRNFAGFRKFPEKKMLNQNGETAEIVMLSNNAKKINEKQTYSIYRHTENKYRKGK